jgi:hypothetical protein
VYVRSSTVRPSPRHSLHGLAMIWPEPPQRAHGDEVTIWPINDWRTR